MFSKAVLPKSKETVFISFAGKGGVGKSTLASATALWLSEKGFKTLLVSTDLQLSLNDIFQQTIDVIPTKINGITHLWALNTDVRSSIANHQFKQMKAVQNLLGKEESAEFQFLKGQYEMDPCCETATYNRMVEFVNSKDFQALVFDTSPGGHSLWTLRYPLKHANDLRKKLEREKKYAKLTGDKGKDFDLLVNSLKQSKEAARLLRSDQMRCLLIMHAELLPILENIRLQQELNQAGINVTGVILNEIIPKNESEKSTNFFKAWRSVQEKYIELASKQFKPLPIGVVPVLPKEIIGVKSLREIAESLYNNLKL